jgi:serine/threonine protein kinase
LEKILGSVTCNFTLNASFTVRTHHVLVHEHATGGESLDVVYSDEHAQQAQLSGSLLWRIWRKDVSTVEWMHARFVVHRDIKLESTSPFPLKKEKLTFRVAHRRPPDS